MQVAAKVLAMTARDLLANSAVINRAEEEFHRRRGAGFKYEALLGDRDPPLDYRR
jgi:aminobenzoyl-glutamate utilization protein B